ncbi:hypothetical protein KFE25_002657 [Diacronema lutheri]|uniref:Uncharacterized protein n=2 Tax=Diacronema lutheri TaxID=2081491 RepID=A0A8J6CD10_DIALT|nr:hypothetical protein KFE25_002657 [Diacronema lutheri]
MPTFGPRRAATVQALAVLATATAAGVAGAGGKSCVGDRCSDTESWCPASHCGAFKLSVPASGAWQSSDGVRACKHIRGASAKRLSRESDTSIHDVYCISLDTRLRGFQCFDDPQQWLAEMLDYLAIEPSGADADAGTRPPLVLNETTCNRLNFGVPYSGTLFVAGQCCTGGAVPCKARGCEAPFVPLGPRVTSSVVSVVLVVIAVMHALTSLQCIVFSDRLIDGFRSVAQMGGEDRASFKNIVAMLGAAHGGFAAVLIFGALQDWVDGKSQVALAALAWYAVLGPIAEAMQHTPGESRFLIGCLSASQAQCGGRVPKVNYLLLCIPLLVAIGVEAFGVHFMIGAGMVVTGLITSLVIMHVGSERGGDTAGERGAAGSEAMH